MTVDPRINNPLSATFLSTLHAGDLPSYQSFDMRLQGGFSPPSEKWEADHAYTSTPPAPLPSNAFSCNETPSWVDPPTAEMRQRTSILRRLKTVSTASNLYASPVVGTEISSRASSSEWRRGPISPPNDRSDKAAKSIISWGGRILRRHGSILALSAFLLRDESERASMEVSETCQRAHQCPIKSKLLGRELKKAISPPFNFHHVTHTHSRQFETLDRGSQNELITEFIAIRASQRPKSTLQGIQADDVQNDNNAKRPNERKDLDSVEEEDGLDSLTGLPNTSASTRPSPISSPTSHSIRSSPSIENFSRPTPWSSTSPRSPPPRISSRRALQTRSRSTKLSSTLPQGTVEHPTLHHSVDAQAGLDPGLRAMDSNVPTTHPVTAVGTSGIPLETWPLPEESRDLVSSLSPTASIDAEHGVSSGLNRSASLPLRHANTPPTTEVVSQDDHQGVSELAKEITQVNPESQPDSTCQWEDDVDYCYNNAVQADSNFDWSQKTVFEDRDSIDTSDHQEEARRPGSSDSGPRSEAPQPAGTPANQVTHSRYAPRKSVVELEERLSPFGRHQATSEFRGYQHMTQTASKPTPKLHIASEDLCPDEAALSDPEAYNHIGLETLAENDISTNRCYSTGWSSYGGANLPSPSTHSSVLSSTASTIRTCRSSNSIGSVPDLISSFNSSRESVMVDRSSSTDSVKAWGGLGQIPERADPPTTPARRGSVSARRLTAELPPLPSFAQGRWSRDEVAKAPMMVVHSLSPAAATTTAHGSEPFPPTLHESVDRDRKADVLRMMKSQPVVRRRAASAATPGRPLPPPLASYSLFPSSTSTLRLT